MKDLYISKMMGHNPSLDVNDVRLLPGWYLLKRSIIKAGDIAQTRSGLVIPIGKKSDMVEPNVAKVTKRADSGCILADVGDYVIVPMFGGTDNQQVKAQPLVKHFTDDDGWFLIQEKNILGVIPESNIQLEVGNAGDDEKK